MINFDLPHVPEDYVHRIGRIGRVRTSGLAVSVFSENELKQLQSIERVVGVKFELEIIPGFAPSEKAPADSSDDEEHGNFEADLIQGDVHAVAVGSGELLELHWVSLKDAQKLELPIITRMILKEVERRLVEGHSPDVEGPFIHFRNGKPIIDKI